MVLFLVFSCKKEEGCTNPSALNYNSEAKDDDGSCEYLTSEDTATVYFFAKDDTLIFLGDTLFQMPTCPNNSDITEFGYAYNMQIDKDYFDGDYDGQTFFSFGNTDNLHYSFQGHLQKIDQNTLEFLFIDPTNSVGINPSLSADCINESGREVVIVDFN